jgi:hypothetical protein
LTEFAQTDYDLAAFIVRFLVLPVLVACAVVSACSLRNWKGLGRSWTITYNVAVATFLMFAQIRDESLPQKSHDSH